MRKPVWLFSEGSLKRRDLLGNKGANLCEMTSLGMPVPFGFIITTQTHLEHQRLRQRIPEGTMEEVKAALLKMEIRQGPNSAIRSILCSFQFVPELRFPCPG